MNFMDANPLRTWRRPCWSALAVLVLSVLLTDKVHAQEPGSELKVLHLAQQNEQPGQPLLPEIFTDALKNLTQQGGPPVLPGPNLQPSPPAQRGFTIPLVSPEGQDAIELRNEDGLVSLVVRDAPLRHIMALLADAHGLNLVFASSTDVPITATFDKVPLGTAIDSLLHANGFTWTKTGNVIYVTNVAEAAGLPAEVQGREVKVLELDFASAADIDQGVKGLLSPVGKSWVLESSDADNRRTKEAIVVEDLAFNLQRVEAFVAEADQPPRQVLIEVHLLEVELDKECRAGVNLEGLARLSGAQFSARSVGLANAMTSPSFFVENTATDLNLLIEALITTTDAKTIAQPRVLAVNGQEARIQIGRRIGFNDATTNNTSGVTQQSVAFLNTGVELKVTPRITRDGRVLMDIFPKVSDGLINPTTDLPDEDTTELETNVLLRDGQGMVVGGLIQERDAVTTSRVPVLSRIPYAGFLFERKQEEKLRTELIIALKPHVLPYSPILQANNDFDVARAYDPLLHGPLCRYPRPYEARLPGTENSGNIPSFLKERERCPPRAACADTLQLTAEASHGDSPRRLPPIEQAERMAIRPEPKLFY